MFFPVYQLLQSRTQARIPADVFEVGLGCGARGFSKSDTLGLKALGLSSHTALVDLNRKYNVVIDSVMLESTTEALFFLHICV